MKSLLLHTCCAPCAAHPIQQLKEDFDITVFYYNPNIYPKSEYETRMHELKKYCEKLKVDFIEAEYDVDNWSRAIKGLEKEPEKGKRCTVCFDFRLKKTVKFASENNYDVFSTTLTISPHKNSKIINSIGKALSIKFSIEFLEKDFKKQDGFKKACKISRKNNFYRQKYCGCEFSKLNF